jgi:PAS domain S-box-containing protein
MIGVWGSARDVTERRRLQEMGNARRVSEERAKWEQERARWEEQRADWLAAILDQMPVGVGIVAAPEGRTLLVNRALERVLGLKPSLLNLADYGRTWQAMRSDGTPIPLGELPRVRALRGEMVAGEELTISHSNGQRVQLMVSAAPLMEEGRITAGVVVMADISGQKQVQRQLEEAGRLKDEFLSMASHELKTPITSIKIYSELVTRRPEVAAKRLPELMATLNRQADQLVSLVDDLLEVSRLELGRMPIELRRLDLAALVRQVCKSPQYDSRQLSCPPPDLSLMVEGDPVRLEQVLSNLLDNAVKYSPRGGPIWVRLEQGAGHALIEVEDRGIGIPPQHLPHVFKRFYKPGPQQAVYSGLGVGLYISKEIVERHRGRIWAESQEGQGSKFVVELPLAERESL